MDSPAPAITETTAPARKIPKWVIPAAKTFIGVLLLLAIGYTLVKAYGQILENSALFSITHIHWPWLALCGVLYAAALPFPAMYWYVVLRHLDQKPPMTLTIRAHIIGHLGKYVPGKVMVLLMRAGMLRGKGTDTTVAVLSIFLEGFMQMAVGALMVVAVFLWWAWSAGGTQWLPYILPLLAVCCLPFFPPVFKRVVKIVAKKKFSDHLDVLDKFRWPTILAGIPLMAGFWLILGLSYWAVLQGIGLDVSLAEYPRYLATISLAMVAGFVVVLMPGGIGVREAVMVLPMMPLLATVVSTSGIQDPKTVQLVLAAAGLIAAIALRLVWLAVELLLAGVLYVSYKFRVTSYEKV